VFNETGVMLHCCANGSAQDGHVGGTRLLLVPTVETALTTNVVLDNIAVHRVSHAPIAEVIAAVVLNQRILIPGPLDEPAKVTGNHRTRLIICNM
jgi:hypothetical protein